MARGGAEPGEMLEIARGGDSPQERAEKADAHAAVDEPRAEIARQHRCSSKSAGGDSRLFVFEGWRTIAEVDADGKVVGRHALDLPEQAAITFVRTATDKSGQRYFVASAPLAPQFFVFDDAWKLLLACPPDDEAPLSLVDLALADVGEADGMPEILAGSVGDVGLVALSLTGEVRWRNRAFPNAVSIAVSQPDDIGSWGIFVTGERGAVLRVNRFGKEEPPVTIGTWPDPAAAWPGDSPAAKQAALLGLSNNAKGEMFAVGLTSQLKEVVELSAAGRRASQADRAGRFEPRFCPATRANGGSPAPTAPSTSSPRTASCSTRSTPAWPSPASPPASSAANPCCSSPATTA